MRILQLIDVYKTGGAEKVFDNLSVYCKDNNIDTNRFSLYKGSIDNNLDYLIEYNKKSFVGKFFQQIFLINKLRKILEKGNYDMIISFLDRSNIVSIIAAEFLKIRVVVTVHNPPTVQYKKLGKFSKIVFCILRIFYNKKYVKVIAVSNQVKNSLSDIGISNIEVVYNPIFIKEKEQFSENKSDNNYFIAVGRLEYQKAFWKLIKAVKILDYKYKENIKLKILGDGILNESLRKLILELNLENSIELLGFVKNPLPIIKNSLAMIFSSYYEGFPITVLEAFSLSIPVIGAKCAIPEEIRNLLVDFNSLFYTNKNNDENFTLEFEADDYKIAEILHLALRNTNELFKIAEIGKKWVKNNCSLDNFGSYF